MTTREGPEPSGGGVVLVVGPDRALGKTLDLALSDAGYEVRVVDPCLAADACGAGRIGLVLLDAFGSGDAVAMAIRSALGGDVPIVALTTRPGDSATEGVGAAATLPMPFDIDALLGVVAQLHLS